MLSSKIDSISKYNNLVQHALSATIEFPDNLCDYLVSEYELEAAVLLKVKDKTLELLGKSASAKKSLTHSTEYSCSKCQSLQNASSETRFEANPECEFRAADMVTNEGCLHITVTETEKVVLKIAANFELTNVEKDNFIIIGNTVKTLLLLWMGKKGGLSYSISEILSKIGPDLRTPINSILGFASLLNEESLTKTQLEYLSTLKDNAYDLLALLNDLIDLVKIESSQSSSEITEIKIGECFNDIFKIFEDKVYTNRIEIISNIDKDLPESVNCNYQKIQYIIANLLTTSLRLTEKGKISVSVFSPEKNRLNIRISDTGVGIASEKLKDIFKPFALTDQYITTVGNTTGLSLTLVDRYVNFLDANLEVTSTLGKGTTFNLSIPVEEISVIEKQISSLPRPDFTNKVLVVEDDYATSKLLSNYLNKWGYEPTIVNSAEQTLKILNRDRFLAILMDIVLPDANGLELLQKIREINNAKSTPVIICSVEAEQQKAFLMGAVEYFVKPINYKYLIEVLTNYRLKKDSNILLVDDDIPSLNLLKEAVERTGLKAVAFSDSTQVLDAIQNSQIDLAIIDLDMPEIDGIELIERIKTLEQFKNLPIIIYTGKENFTEDIKRIDGLFESLLQKRSTSVEDLQKSIELMINKYDEPATQEEVKEKKDSVKILLVEDYKHSQIIVTRLLKKNDFESIVVVENGQEALDAVKEQHYDLILMDMQMPVMNGFEATRKIRELKEYKDTPIVALTAFAMKGDREKCLDAGATDYIPKPIDSQEFIQKVKYYTENKMVAKS
jgi:CheY-like chemotaxis protein